MVYREVQVTREDIDAADERIAGWIRRTPVMELERGAFGLPGKVSLKLEQLQRSGTFKGRGAFYLLLNREVPEAGVVAASGGNFGAAIAYAARALGHHATIFVPEVTSEAKQAKLRALGAELIVTGDFYADALAASKLRVAETGALFAHAYDQFEVVAGAGTCGRELAAQQPDVETVMVATGGGGLIGGIATWFGGDVRVVSVESEQTATLASALAAGEPVDVKLGGVAADALGATRIGEIGFAAAQRWVDRALLVSDEAIITAQHALWDQLRIACEPASAAPLAALMAGAYVPAAHEHVCILICGANLDPATLSNNH
jgi:threonine dehydratase